MQGWPHPLLPGMLLQSRLAAMPPFLCCTLLRQIRLSHPKHPPTSGLCPYNCNWDAQDYDMLPMRRLLVLTLRVST